MPKKTQQISNLEMILLGALAKAKEMADHEDSEKNEAKEKKLKETAYDLIKRENLNFNYNHLINLIHHYNFTLNQDSNFNEPGLLYKNAQDVKWLNPIEVTAAFNIAVQEDNINKQNKGLPVARYDKETKQAYLEFVDGKREYV